MKWRCVRVWACSHLLSDLAVISDFCVSKSSLHVRIRSYVSFFVIVVNPLSCPFSQLRLTQRVDELPAIQSHHDELPAEARRPTSWWWACSRTKAGPVYKSIRMSWQPCTHDLVCDLQVSKSSMSSFSIKRHRYMEKGLRFCYDDWVFVMFNVWKFRFLLEFFGYDVIVNVKWNRECLWHCIDKGLCTHRYAPEGL